MKKDSVTLIAVLLAMTAGNTMAAEEAELTVSVKQDQLDKA